MQIDLSYGDLRCRAVALNAKTCGLRVYGVPNGGIYAALLLASHVPEVVLVEDPLAAECFVDDIVDSGRTREIYQQRYGPKPFYALVDKTNGDAAWKGKWVSFPWERAARQEGPEQNIVRLLQYIGENPDREGLRETPARVLRSYAELFSGYKQDPASVFKTFEDGACDELVLLKGIDFVSHCEHHLMPFSGVAHIAYLPSGKIIGLSKLARLLDIFARRLQVQERLTVQVTQALDQYLNPRGSACVIEASHGCMTCRGARKQNAVMVTSSLTGRFKDDSRTRSEFLTFLNK